MTAVERRTEVLNPIVFVTDILGRHHGLVEELQNPPDSREVRQELLDITSHRFYGDHN